MSRIALLSETVASQVAAGEVIERPASVIKELVENSIDAGARKIEVMIRRGGSSFIRVVDDGIGMDRDDALLCLERHATSKIRTGADLAAISTLGFRGEALPSIASVSRFCLATREHGALAGTCVEVSGGKIETVRDGGDAPGTQIEARSLFYNLPARRKFLRAENTEASHCEHQLHLQEIGHPEIAFAFVQNERVVHQLPATANLLDRIRDLCGARLASEMLEVPNETLGGITVRGFLGKPGVSRSSRAQQLVFLNGRAVENSAVNFALREGYHTALMKGQFPVTFLFIEMDPAAVDVNVHPAKREVRFRDHASVREAIVEITRRTLESSRGAWSKTFVRPVEQNGAFASNGELTVSLEPTNQGAESVGPTSASIASGALQGASDEGANLSPTELIPAREQIALRHDWTALPLQPSSAVEPSRGNSTFNSHLTTFNQSNDFRILGVLGKLYVLMENASGLVLVDQHAAHERILFEELRRRMEVSGVPAQRLLMPLTIQLNPRDSDWISLNLATLQKMGIGIEPFGAGTFKIDALPQFLRAGSDPLQLLRDIIDELRETSTHTSRVRLGEDVIATTVCRHAVKANDYLREPELVRLVQDLLRCELPYCCPHGRPTMIQISYAELEKKFGRKV
jgi:DNA mismatch repair protein MutL